MERRTFLKVGAAAAGAPLFAQDNPPGNEPRLIGVLGPRPASSRGAVLPHEHVLVDFIGADRVRPDRYDRDEAFDIILPHLTRAYEFGARVLVECTPAYLARDVVLLERLSEASGLILLTNTGYYGAAEDKFLPPHAFEESADQLAARWIREAEEGIDGTEIRPGFIKIGVDTAPLSEVDGRLVRAAARTHLATGLTIAAHTPTGAAALEELDILEEEGVSAGAWIWVHAQVESDKAIHAEAGRRGAWVEFDGIGPDSVELHVDCVRAMREAGLLDRVLVSHDAGWYAVGEPGGGVFRPFDTLFTRFVPALERAGFSEDEVERLIERNPREAFTVRVRPGQTQRT